MFMLLLRIFVKKSEIYKKTLAFFENTIIIILRVIICNAFTDNMKSIALSKI